MGRPKGSKTKKNGNGHESADTVRERLAAQFESVDEDAAVPLQNLVEISILALFVVQGLGQATLAQVIEQAQAIHADIDKYLLHQSLEALRKRGFLSYATGQAQGTGESTKMWAIRQIVWAAPPEVAHVKDLLPALLATDEAENIIATLNDSEVKEEGEKKAKTRLEWDEYVDLKVKFRTKTPLCGSQPTSPYLEEIVKASKYKGPAECQLRFWRDDVDGALMIPSDVICGWLRLGLRAGPGFAESCGKYMATNDIKLYPKKVSQAALPVIDPKTGQGKGLTTYEMLPSGQEFWIKFRVPTKGFLSPEAFVMWLAAYAPRPLRGLSPARGKRFGKMEVIDYKIIGPSASAETMLQSVMEEDDLSPDAQKLMAQLVLKAKGLSFRSRGKSGMADAEDAGDDQEDIEN